MMLTEIRDYLRARGQASLRDMAIHFDTDEEALRGALDHWIRKGRVRRLPSGTTCSGCSTCAPETIELYAWVGEPATRAADPVAECKVRESSAGKD
ncbi:MAG TPA: sugar metabolism transcriptional regulator [Thiotrichales bacterium]|nr:sugar metabolism transcriptional regulator [Thiotrichales bacterium]